MANFAHIVDNIVENVIVADQSFIDSGALSGTYKEITNGGRGWTWDEAKSIFIAPQPFPSWTLNSDNDWEAPVAMPAEVEGKYHTWNEADQQWDTTDRLGGT
jgi:hypothetical protein